MKSLKYCILIILFQILCFRSFAAKYTTIENIENESLQIYTLAVAHGDAILIKTKNKTALIDTGLEEIADDKLIPELQKIGVKKIDYLFLTHMHTDHIGGAPKVIDQFDIGEVWTNGTTPQKNDRYVKLMEKIKEQNLIQKVPTYRQKLFLEENIWLDFVHKKMGSYAENDENNNSMAMILHYKDLKVFLAADLESKAQLSILADLKSEVICDVYKVQHHGSKKFAEAFVRMVNPAHALFSGKIYPFGFPSKEIKKLLGKKMGTKMHFNDPNTLLLKSNGEVYNITTID